MGQPMSILKAKMKTLMGSYRSERSRENKSRVTGSGTDDVYESKWFGYKYFDFLSDKDTPRQTLDTESEDTQGAEESSSAITNESATFPAASTVASSASDISEVPEIVSATTKQKTGTKRKAADPDSGTKMMGEALQLLQSSSNMTNDPHYTYALNLANELRKYHPYTLAHVKRAISNILFEADIGLFSTPKTVQNNQYSSPPGTSISGENEYSNPPSNSTNPPQFPIDENVDEPVFLNI